MDQSHEFSVPDISCGHCVRTIENELRALDGIATVTADKDRKTVLITWHEPAQIETIKAVLEDIGYPARD